MCSVCFFQGFGFAGTNRGKLLMMNVNKGSVPLELNITNPPSAPNFMANPHGISTWKDEKTGIVAVSQWQRVYIYIYIYILGQKRNAAYKTYIVYGGFLAISRKRCVTD